MASAMRTPSVCSPSTIIATTRIFFKKLPHTTLSQRTMRTWHIFMAAIAFSWLFGVTPAQQEASTEIGISGNAALRIIAFAMTQISVQSPVSSIASGRRLRTASGSANEPNAGFSMTAAARATYGAKAGAISQPCDALTQCTTGRRFDK